jgi:uncharacterized membrane protein YagU involved in acid resistance
MFLAPRERYHLSEREIMRGFNSERSVLLDVVAGAVAGVVATFVMGKVTSFLHEREDPQARREEDEAREGKTAYVLAVEKAAALVGRELNDQQSERIGSGLHWGLGIGAGAAYGVLRHKMPASRWGSGVAFGTAFWALIDEGANTALGLTPPPREFPWQAHARGFAGHLAFGVAADAALRLTDRLLPGSDPLPVPIRRIAKHVA